MLTKKYVKKVLSSLMDICENESFQNRIFRFIFD